ncbi:MULTISPECIES: sigma-70 family RNA polymerase sigma factor [Staphylococcus]|uniref:sigma-70 family RNA polymerase sigma factor n=1 Tax=Staphylococcus TaxID=1279 RepID=UPI000DFABBB4|nr:sigma-70 family RNA polymerase sigma factor [Staphylococcus nepalensis]MDR5650008.1 sigma-70 family RNA polymerase sigma factor [Staphylococcus nepalensis]SUM67732.1 pathogenicity island protein ORF6 [Staphylococcus nepalensis]SUM95278.1 pathogenicity island protein ORF6 [Staphylococcus nepalensis]
MRYDKKTVKQFILNYHKTIDNSKEYDEDTNVDDFFSVNDQQEAVPIDENNVEESIFYNEIETLIEQVATDKEICIFWLLAEGKTYKEVGRIFEVSDGRVRQVFDRLLDKVM